MSSQLGLNVVAEGVETRDQLEFLRRHGCNHIQGYVCSPALSADEFFAMLVSIAGSSSEQQEPDQLSA